jgi:hypothetical protein
MQSKLKSLITSQDIWQKWHWKSDNRYYKVLFKITWFANVEVECD